jgi:hypothetical protein
VFESLRYRCTLKDFKVVALVVAMLTAFAAFELWRSFSSGAVAEGGQGMIQLQARAQARGGFRSWQ